MQRMRWKMVEAWVLRQEMSTKRGLKHDFKTQGMAFLKRKCEIFLNLFLRPYKLKKDCWAFVVSGSLMVMKRREIDRFFTLSDRCHYLRKVLLDRNDQAVLSSIVLYFFGLERHKIYEKEPPWSFLFAVFSNSLNMKRCRVLPLSDSLKFWWHRILSKWHITSICYPCQVC